MKNCFRTFLVAAALAGCATFTVQAQNQRGPRDFDEIRQRMAERMREQFGVTDDAEWKVIEGKIEKVTEARRAIGGGFGFGGPGGPGGFGGRRGGPGGGNEEAGQGNRRGGFGGEQSPEVEELRKAIESKASAEEIKSKLAKVREARKANEAKLEAAQEDLRKVLSVRQEAVAVMMGLVK